MKNISRALENRTLENVVDALFERLQTLPNDLEIVRDMWIHPAKGVTKNSNSSQMELEFGEEVKTIDSLDYIYRSYVRREGINFLKSRDSRSYYENGLWDDNIHIADKRLFKDAESYYKVIFHEVGHSIGNPNRLNRIGLTFERTYRDYFKEELIAEIFACFIMESYGYLTEKELNNSAVYLKIYLLNIRKEDKMEESPYLEEMKKELITATGEVRKSINFFLGKDVKKPGWSSPFGLLYPL